MSLQDLYMGLGSLAYAVAKADGQLQPAESRAIRDLLAAEPFGDVAGCAFTLNDFHHESAAKAYAWAIRCFQQNLPYLTPVRQKRFLDIATRIAEAHNGVAEAEQLMLEQLRADFHQLTAPALVA